MPHGQRHEQSTDMGHNDEGGMALEVPATQAEHEKVGHRSMRGKEGTQWPAKEIHKRPFVIKGRDESSLP